MGQWSVGARLLGSAAVAVVLGAAGCGSSEDPPAASGASRSAPSSASASTAGTGTPSSGTSAEATKRATSATRKALLPSTAFAKVDLAVDEEPSTKKWDWFGTCRPTLPSESKQVIVTAGQWKGDGALVSQTVVAYPDGVAEDIVAEVKKAVSCGSYSANGRTFSTVKPMDLPKVDSADAKTAWCVVEAEEDETICHSVIASQDLVSSLWVRSGDADGAKDAMAVLTLLAAERIKTQIR